MTDEHSRVRLVVERFRAFALVFFYFLVFFTILASLGLFVINPIAAFIKYGLFIGSFDMPLLVKWAKITLATSLIMTTCNWLWTEWEVFQESRSRTKPPARLP